MRLLAFARRFEKIGIADGLHNIFTDFVTAHPNMRTDGCSQRVRLNTKLLAHPHHGLMRDICGRTSPSSVDGSDGATFNVCNEDRHAIGGLYRESHTSQ